VKPLATNSLLDLSPCLKKLKVEKIELEDFSCIKNLKQLRDLELNTMGIFLDKPLRLDWILEMPNLRRLDLGGCQNTEGFLSLDRLKHLESLALPSGLDREAEVFQTISKCTQLEELKIFSFDRNSPIAWNFLFGCPELETLVISGHVLPPDLIETLAKLTQLQRLELNLHGIPDLNWVSELKFLRVLKLSGDSDFHDFSPLFELRELAELELPVDGQKFDVAIVEQLPKLEYDHLVLNNSTGEHFRNVDHSLIIDTVLDLSLTNAQEIPEKVRIAKLEFVYLSQDISDLERLRGAPVKYFRANGSAISDLSPLSGAPLIDVQLNGTRVTDLSPILKPVLTKLEVANTTIPNLDQLQAKVPRLYELDISGTPIKDLSALEGIETLRNFKFAGTPVEDITPLEKTRLFQVDLSGTLVKDLTILKVEILEVLKLANTSIQDLSLLNRAPNLELLDISGTSIVDISGVSEKLETLKANDTPLSDVSPLRRLGRLRELDLSGTKVQDISSLANLAHLTVLKLPAGTNYEEALHSKWRKIKSVYVDGRLVFGEPE